MAAAAVPIAEGLGEAVSAAGPLIVRGLAAIGITVGAKKAADRMAKAKADADARTRAAAKDETCKDCPCKRTVVISRARSPLAAQHIVDAQAAGWPRVLTYDPVGAAARGRRAVRQLDPRSDIDRDEYPPKIFAEGGATASVRYVPISDNRSAGGQMASQLAGATPGCKVTMTVGP